MIMTYDISELNKKIDRTLKKTTIAAKHAVARAATRYVAEFASFDEVTAIPIVSRTSADVSVSGTSIMEGIETGNELGLLLEDARAVLQESLLEEATIALREAIK